MAEQTIGTARIDITASAEGVEAAAAKAKRSISDLSKDAQIQYDRLTAAERRRVDALNRQVDTLGMTRAEQLAYNASLRTSGPLHDELVRKLKQHEAAQKAANSAMLAGGLSAKEMEWAMRGVPAQITDIVTSLQGGQRPLTVFIQQGGQLKDMFGGVVPAAKALTTTLVGMINPYTVVAAAAAGLAVAYHQGSAELDEFNRHATMTGNALGVSASQVSMLAGQMDRLSGITRGGAVRALTEVAASGKIAADQMQMVAEVALRSSQLLGRETADVVEEFAKLAGEPSKAAAELNEKYNFLTTSVYQQIRALEEQGRTQDAVRMAAEEFGRATTERLNDVERSLGSVERAWNLVKNAAKDAWDDMLDVGRPDTLQDQLKEAVKRLEALRVLSRTSVVGDPFGRVEEQERRVAAIRAQIDSEQEALGLEQARAEIRKSFIEAEQRWQAQTLEFLSKRDRMEKEIEQTQKDALRLGIEGKELNDRIAAIREKYTEKAKSGISTTQTELARLNALIEAEKQRETALHTLGAAQTSLNEGEKLAIQYGEKLKLTTDAKTKAQLTANKALAEEYGARKRANDVFEKELKDRQSAIDAAKKQTERLRDQIETYGMGKSAIEAMTIARLEERLAIAEGEPELAKTVEGLREEIAARKELLSAMRTKEQLDAQLKEWQAWEREVDRIFDRVGQSLTDKIVDGGFKARDLLKDIFKAVTFNVLINPVMGAMQGWVTNQLGGMFGYQNPQQSQTGGLNPLSLFTNFEGSVADSLLNVGGYLYDSSNKFISDLGASLFRNADAIGKFADTAGSVLGYGKAIYDLTQGNYGRAAGTAIGTYFGGPVGAFFGGELGGLVDGIFDREPTTRREQRTQVEYADGLLDITKRDDRVQAGADVAVAQMTAAAIQSANSLFQQIGVDATIESFRSIMASSHKRDRDGVASGGTLRVGDQLIDFGITDDTNPTLGGFGGWSSVDPMQRIGTEIQLSMLEALKAVSDELPGVLSAMLEGIDVRSLGEAEAQALAERFTALTQGAAAFLSTLEQTPFAELRDLSFDAAAAMVQFAGGIDNLLTAQQTYYERFYSEQEKFEHSVDLIGKALSEVGLEMPALVGSTDDMLASYRALVESLDLNTEAGQQAYVTLMQTAGAFADVAQFAGQAAVESQRIADQARTDALRDLQSAYNAVVQAGQREIAKLQESFGATDSAMSAYRSAVQRLESEFNSLFTAIDRGVQALRGTGAAAEAQYHQARAVISTTLLTGQLPQTADLSEAIRVAQQGVMGQRYSSLFEQQKAYLSLANEIEALQDIAKPELDTAKATLEQLEDQYRLLRGMSEVGEDSLSALEAQLKTAIATEEAARYQISVVEQQLEEARRQYDALTGIDTSIKDLATAMREFAEAVAAAQTVVGGGGGGGGGYPTDTNAGLPWDKYPVPVGPGSDYQRAVAYYNANPDVAAAFNKTSGVSFVEFAKEHYEKYGRAEGRKAFATGTSYVPYDMTADIHRGEIIIDPRSSDILRRYGIGVQGGVASRETEQLLREQLAEVRQQNRYLYEIVKSGKRNERNTEDVANAIAHGDSDGVVVVM